MFQNEFYIPQDRNCDFLCLCPTRGSSDRFLLFGRSFQFLCCSLKITLKLIIRSCELLSSKLQHFLAIGNIKCVWQNKNNSIEGNNYTLYIKQDFMNSHWRHLSILSTWSLWFISKNREVMDRILCKFISFLILIEHLKQACFIEKKNCLIHSSGDAKTMCCIGWMAFLFGIIPGWHQTSCGKRWEYANVSI